MLNSVVDSIQSGKGPLPTPVTTTGLAIPNADKDVSPTTRRNRDLAQVLFGLQEKEDGIMNTSPDPSSDSLSPERSNLPADPSPTLPLFTYPPLHPISPPSEPPFSASSLGTRPYQPARNPSTPRLPQSPEEEAELAREVQRKTEAAMFALKKPPSGSNLREGLAPKPSVSRRRISPNQISTPQLVSASTSVDTIPLQSPSINSGQPAGPSKLGSRFKKFRGSLRTKNLPTGEEVTPFPLDLRSPPPPQIAHYDPVRLNVTGGSGAASATELGGFRVPVPSPPASAGPGLKGFMARFRGKQRSDTVSEYTHQGSSHLSPNPSSSSPALYHPSQRSPPSGSPLEVLSPTSHLNSATQPKPERPSPSASTTPRPRQSSPQPSPPQTEADESQALKQLFDAASNLGLDQSALTALLARSASTSSRSTDWTMLTRNNSSVTNSRPTTRDEALPERGHHALPQNGQANLNDPPNPQIDHKRRPRQGQVDNNAVVRRTIIMPSESRASNIDLNTLIRKNSSRRRRASTTSFSSRSVHDRAPTPPPARSSRRFSVEPSPPVPHLPQGMSFQTDQFLGVSPTHPGGGMEKSSAATYDSL